MQPQNLKKVEQIINSTVPTSLELELIELIINHRITLGGISLSFADIVDRLKIEFSPVLKTRTIEMDANMLRARLKNLKIEEAALDREIQELRQKEEDLLRKGIDRHNHPEFQKMDMNRGPSLFDIIAILRDNIKEIEQLLNSGSNKIVKEDGIVLGEFISSPSPWVVLYYNHFKICSIRYKKLLGVFVHEMIHAWFYFMANENPRSVLAVDEPIVEFSALFFLQDLLGQMLKTSHPAVPHIKDVLVESSRAVQNKQFSFGNLPAYGYGYFLYEHLGEKSQEWIAEYSRKSSSISSNDPDVQDFQNALIPCYPFRDEHKLKNELERIIFGPKIRMPKGRKTSKSSSSKGSGRTMFTYPSSKSDPICKWRNASIATVVELVSMLPKIKMAKEDFRNAMSGAYGGAYFRTPYQLALQLGLYYEDDKEYIPRFNHNITDSEAETYMFKWMERYYVPNPYTKKGFINIVPSINLLNGLVDYLANHPSMPNLATAGAALFGGEMGNIGNVRYVLNEYSKTIDVDAENNMSLLIHRSGTIEVYNARDDKKAFFDHFN